MADRFDEDPVMLDMDFRDLTSYMTCLLFNIFYNVLNYMKDNQSMILLFSNTKNVMYL